MTVAADRLIPEPRLLHRVSAATTFAENACRGARPMAYSPKAVLLSDAAILVAESLGQESGREPRASIQERYPIREARYELVQALRDGAIDAEGEHRIASDDRVPRIEIRKVSRVWWARAIVEPPRRVDLWKPGGVYVSWSVGGALVIGPWCSPPPAGHAIDGAIAVLRIRLEREALLAIWPIAELSRERSQTAGAPETVDDPEGRRERQANGETPTARRRRHGPAPTADKIKEAGQTLIDEGYVPAETVSWKEFETMLWQKLTIGAGARGYSRDSIQNALRPLLQKRQAAKLSSESTESTES
jgi:hypothetical protein